jgi:hypothetical protein
MVTIEQLARWRRSLEAHGTNRYAKLSIGDVIREIELAEQDLYRKEAKEKSDG